MFWKSLETFFISFLEMFSVDAFHEINFAWVSLFEDWVKLSILLQRDAFQLILKH
jgi:hypothetical protein